MPDIKPEDILPLFVYGTLRPGQPLYSVIQPALLAAPVKACVYGWELYANRSGSYPYMTEARDAGMLRDKQTDPVRGTLMLCDLGHRAVRDVHRIESGYDFTAVDVHYRNHDNEEKVMPGYAYTVGSGRWGLLGEYITDGDWVRWSGSRRRIPSAAEELETIRTFRR